MKQRILKNSSTNFLRLALIGICTFVTLNIALLGWSVYAGWVDEFPDSPDMRFLAMAVLATTLLSFYYAAYQATKLLSYIDKNTVFSSKSVNAFSKIKQAALAMTAALFMGMPLVYMVAEKDDAPGLILLGMFFAGAPLVIAVGSAVAQRLVENVIRIKTENDLTV